MSRFTVSTIALLLLVLSPALHACRSQPAPSLEATAKAEAAPTRASEVEPPAPAAPDEALVVGLRDAKGELRTLFVDAKGFTVLGEGVAVPRDDGWWKLDRRRHRDASGKNRADTLFATTDRAWQAPAYNFADMETCESEMSLDVLFVGSDHVTYEESGGGYCEGAAHPYAYTGLHTVTLQDIKTPRALPINDLLGAPALASLESAGVRVSEKCLSDPDATEWGLVRRQGRWSVRGRLTHAYEVCRGSFKDFTVPGVSPRNLTGHDDLPLPWNQMRSRLPGALDAVASPSKRVVVFVTTEGLALEVDGKEVARHRAPSHFIVLAQWAVGGRNVERWRTEAAAILK